MGFIFYLEIMIAIGALLYIGWIFYPYYKSGNNENISWRFLINNHKKQLLYGVVSILLVITVYLTVGPVRYTNNVYLWQWQHGKISKLISKERNIVAALRSPKNKNKDEKAYTDYVNYISEPRLRLRDYEGTAKLERLSGFELEQEENIRDIMNTVGSQNEAEIGLAIIGDKGYSDKNRRSYAKVVRSNAVDVSKLSFLEFMESNTYYDNKDKLDKIVKSKMI